MLIAKLDRASRRSWSARLVFTLTLGLTITLQAADCRIYFNLDEPSKTSAGVFLPDGTLIRTLWNKVVFPEGSQSAIWDGLDDSSNPVPAGTYQIKLLEHKTEYVWDGVIGNTSAAVSGFSVHTGFLPMHDMTIAGTNVFYVSGYNEGKYDFCTFLTTDPQRVKIKWGADGQPSNIYDRNWSWTVTDGNWVYFACSAATNPTNTLSDNYPGFVVASKVGVSSPAFSASFTQGVPIVNGANGNSVYPNGIYVGTQSGLSGLAVQRSGNLLAVAVAPDNRVYLLDKLTGAAVRNFNVSLPGRLSFSPDGSLWVISDHNVICYTNLDSIPSAARTISSLSKPLAVAVEPADPDLILVADGGSSQQVKAFNSSATSLWTFGMEGGYQRNGPAVATNKFWFYDGESDGTFLCFAPDGSFWVGDGGNHRSMHFSVARNYLEQIMYQPHSYMTCVDQNNPTRVFNQFLEFQVDYNKPLSQAWTLVNNWKANVDRCNISWNEGLREVTTFTNGRTYALIDNNCTANQTVQEVCELGPDGLRLSGIFPFKDGGWISLSPDGSVRVTSRGAARWYQSTLNGFDTNGNPAWNPGTLIASAPAGGSDPVPRCCSFGNVRATISTNNILISFDQSLNNGWHLGGIKVGATNWLWKASPAGSFLNGLGNYEIANGVPYAGNTAHALGRQVVFGYHGEFFRDTGEAAQHMHFYDNGLFVGQFGEALNGHQIFEGALPGFAGNGHSPSLTETTSGGYYLWVNDESNHGPQRWHFVNVKNIREQIGSGILGGAITLTNQACGFPARVAGRHGNQLAQLSWQPVPGATSYNIRYSLINGGPYNALAGNTTGLDYAAVGLTNGQTYYFAVTAIRAGTEGIPSVQVEINPFDTSQTVLRAGSMSEGGQYTPVIQVSSSAPAVGQPSYLGAEHLTGVLNLRELNNYGYGNLQNTIVGTKGYALFEYQGPATSLLNIVAPFTYAYGGGWKNFANLARQYRVDNALNMNSGMVASPVGTLLIGAGDTNYHYLTVVSPAQFDNPRKFTLAIISTNGTSAQFSINESPGLSHIFQFLFKGDITIRADAIGGSGAIIQAIFLDDAPVTFLSSATQTIPTTTALSSSANPAVAGSAVTFSAVVNGSGGVPTGTVAFLAGTNNLGGAVLNSSGVAILNTSALSPGGSPHAIKAVYSGNPIFGGSTSSELAQSITLSGQPPADITNGLVAYYPLSANGNDAWGGNNLTLVGSPAFSSGAISWNGAVPTLGYSSPRQWPQSGLTISAWINLMDPAANYTVAACYGNYSNTVGAAYVQFYTWAGTLNARIVQTRDVNYIGRTTAASLSGGWHFVAVTWAGGTSSSSVRIYLDGVPVDNADNKSGTFTGAYAGSDVPISVGAQLRAGYPIAAQFSGSEKAVRIYDRAFSESEINTLYSNGVDNAQITNHSVLPPPTGLRIIFP